MIPKEFRLKKMKDFDILFKEGKFVNDKIVSVKIWQIDPNKYPRRKYTKNDLKIGFVVGVKIDKRAVIRNRLKRQMREVVRLLLKNNKLQNGFHLLIIAKPEILNKTYQEIEKSIISLLKKGRVTE